MNRGCQFVSKQDHSKLWLRDKWKMFVHLMFSFRSLIQDFHFWFWLISKVLACSILFRYCGVEEPSWREIKHFVSFFDNQISDCEGSIFCDRFIVEDALPGFKVFVIKFMLQMSKVFECLSYLLQSVAALYPVHLRLDRMFTYIHRWLISYTCMCQCFYFE